MTERKLPAVHPGEVLREEFLGPMNISQYRLANSIRVSARRINEIVHEKRAISADTALRLGIFFGTSPEFWLNLQAHYDLETQRMKLGPQLQRDVLTHAAPGAFTSPARVATASKRITHNTARSSSPGFERSRPVAHATLRKAVKHR